MENKTPMTTNKYWMSLEQWRKDPEFAKLVENEFLSSPLQSEDGEGGWARREFLKLMGASIALTTFGCVRRPAQKIIPYAKRPAEVIPGIPDVYASSYVDGFETMGLLVTTREGRPLKIEGNPDFKGTNGGMSARAHAHILKLYDPDRATGPMRNLQNDKRTNRQSVGVTWEALDKDIIEQLKKGQVALLTAQVMSPSTEALVDDFVGATGAKRFTYNDLDHETVLDGNKASYGSRALPVYNLEKARVIVTINNDFLGTWLTPVHFNKQFSEGRRASDKMNKLISFESCLTMTGTNADQRFRIRPSQSLDVVMAIIHELVAVKKVSKYAGQESVVRTASAFAKNAGDLGFSVSEVADELWANRGQSIVLAGGAAGDTEDGVALVVATNFLNSLLENDGKTVSLSAMTVNERGLEDLIQELNKKAVKTLIIHGTNPYFSLPESAKFADAVRNVETVIYTGDRNDETGAMADFLACDHHPLENWSDARSLEGELTIQQPTIMPLHNTRAYQDSLLAWMKGLGKGSARAKNSATWYDYLHSNWRDNLAKGRGGSFDDAWVNLLQAGVVEGSARNGGARGANVAAMTALKPGSRKSGFELVLYPTVGLGDSQLANVPWLQEFPDPVTKIVWDNYASFSLNDARQLKLKEGQHVTLTVGDAALTVPAHIQPGHADGVVGLALGYGRKGAGTVADGVGVNAYQLAGWSGGRRVLAGLETKVKVDSDCTKIACTQDHHSMEGRQIVVEETLKDHLKNPGGRVHRHNITTMWSEHPYRKNKWGMVVDLNSCTGCGSCVIACQSENNIPTVGKRNILSGREMHWIRIDRYYTGMPEDPGIVHQPLLCQHCDNAPCETVCPVAATVHSDEGTNDMIYNRCVGTRYCSNNCPYKVRRFNWFDYTEVPEPRTLALNPEVTVRHRGVMEKCTFCIHRIRYYKVHAKLEDRELKVDEFQTACQQSCPTKAITFGDLNNEKSAVVTKYNESKSYSLLEELNTRPAVRYQVKVRNVDEIKGQTQHHEEGHHA